MLPVYPRWRGEHRFDCVIMSARFGLSPLARGTQALPWCDRINARFIPAGAGNTNSYTFFHFFGPVYPRWRGEHQNQCRYDKRGNGLSPLARGTPVKPGFCEWSGRFIPAGAGNTDEEVWHLEARAVYPRWRGEHWRVVISGDY